MALQYGLFYTNGCTAKPSKSGGTALNRLNDHDVISGTTIDGVVEMGFHGYRITEEQTHEKQPLAYGPFLITFDGRLDNRKELLDRLCQTTDACVTDPQLIAESCERFGAAAISTFIGEFAFALWCRQTQSVLLARSHCGTRTLYYTKPRCGGLIWATDLPTLLRLSGNTPTVNEDYVLQYLTLVPTPAITPFSNMFAIQPATFVRFTRENTQAATTFWRLDQIQPTSLKSDQEYEEAFRQKITKAVKVRLRAKAPIFAELSGGFDSSSVVLLADKALRDRNIDPKRLQTVSCVYEKSLTCDETGFIDAVEQKRNNRGHWIQEHEQSITLGLSQIQFTGVPNALHCTSGRYPAFQHVMSKYGSRVLLTGLGGDDLFCSQLSGTILAGHLLRKFRLGSAHTELLSWSDTRQVPYWQLLFCETLPCAFIPRLATRQMPSTLIAPRYSKLENRLIDYTPGSFSNSPADLCRFRSIELLRASLSTGYFTEFKDIHVSHPFTHRPFIEFCLSIPSSQFVRHGQTRSLLKRALRELLPVKLLRRHGKSSLDEALLRAIHKETNTIGNLEQWRVCQREYIHLPALREAFNEAKRGLITSIGALVPVFALERWLRSLEIIAHEQSSSFPASPTSYLPMLSTLQKQA